MEKAQSIIEDALSAIRLELRSRPIASPGDILRQQLLRVERELGEMLAEVRQHRSGNDHAGLGRMVVDSWPLQHELSERVCAAVDAYTSAMCGGLS